MKTIIYKLFLLTGLAVSFFGFSDQANAMITTEVAQQPKIKTLDDGGKLYFSDVIRQGQEGDLIAAHYSHSSHRSHSSHYSHRSSSY
jgi:hypothetical protein